MTKHTTQEILAVYSKGAENTLESAALATYDLGYSAGEENIKRRVMVGDPLLRKEIDERHRAETALAEQRAQGEKDAADAGREAQHQHLAARKRELADKDQDEVPAAGAKKPAATAHPKGRQA